jgi:putative ABC transport system substrate-binding protein
MRRREFLGIFGACAATSPISALAQRGHIRRIGVLMGGPHPMDDAIGRARFAAFEQGLQQLGWTDRRNVRIDVRWVDNGNAATTRKYAAELVALGPDVILALTTPVVQALQQATRTVPIVFVGLADPVSAGFVASLARPGGNTTGFISFEYGTSAKWLELLKEIDPRVTRAAVLRGDPTNPTSLGLLAAMQGVAPSLRMELSPIDVRQTTEMERAIAEFARGPGGGLIVTPLGLTTRYRGLISTVAARHRLPAVYPDRIFVADGGLISYGVDRVDLHRHAAGYVDRILKGEKPANLPVQAPTKYQLVINLKTAKTLGLTVPSQLLSRADEVIE